MFSIINITGDFSYANWIEYKLRSMSLNLWLNKIQYELENKVRLSIDALEFAKTF